VDVILEDIRKRYPVLAFLRKCLVFLRLEPFVGLDRFIRDEVVPYRIDSVTGLMVRTYWYRRLREELLKAYPFLARWDSLDLPELKRETETCEFATPFWVVFGDVARLSRANSLGGHGFGDQFLRAVAGAMAGVGESFGGTSVLLGRIGQGDEMAALLVGKSGDEARAFGNMVESAVEGIRMKVTVEESVALESNGSLLEIDMPRKIFREEAVAARIDIGVAGFRPAAAIFRLVVEAALAGETSLPPGSRLSTLEEILVRVADRRADLNKIYGRIHELVERWKTDREEYYRLISHDRKGADEITDEEVEDLARMSALVERGEFSLEDFEKTVAFRVLRRRKGGEFLADLIERSARSPFLRRFGLEDE
jgi:GGDEF domain-containing protein